MANKPNIRFKGFTDDWEQRKVEDIMSCVTDYVAAGSFADIKNNVTYLTEPDYAQLVRTVDLKKKFANTDYVFVDKNAFDYLWRVNLNEDCIVLPNIGANIGEVYYVEPSELPQENNVLGPNAILLKTEEEKYFIFTSLTTDDFQRQLFENVGSSGQPKFNKTELKNISLWLPSVEEQKKIGDTLRNLDHLITLHQRKCDETKKLKKFMLQKMFPKNGEKNPEIRFAGFTDDWEQRKLGEICERLTRKNKDNESDLPLTISSQHGLIDQRDFFNKVVAAKDMSEYYLLQKGEFAYNKSYSNGYDYGSIKRLNSYEKGCLSTLYICFKLISDKVNSDYLECYFDTLAWYHDVSQICSEGARNHGLLNVDVKAFFTEVTVKLPVDVMEQQQISAILHSLDHLITLHQRKCDKLKLIKKFKLQNMFPKKG